MVQAADSIRRARPLLGTFVEISASGAAPEILEAAVEEAFGAIARVHRLMSFHDPDSDVTRLNRNAARDAVEADPWTCEVLETALDLHRRSQGIFDITVAPVLQERGLLPRAPGQRRLSAKAEASSSGSGIDLLAENRIRFQCLDTVIDLGGIAKGFAVDRAAAALRRRGVPEGVVNAGGDLIAFGPSPHTVHIRHPRSPGGFLGAIGVRNEALASSGTHFDPRTSVAASAPAIIDPATTRPAQALAGATVRAKTCMIADALTKIVMVAGEGADSVLAHYGAEALIVMNGGIVHASAGWEEPRHAA